MRIAVPVWENKISPVLDTAEIIRVYDFENGIIAPREEFSIRSHGESAAYIIAEKADVVICGALSSILNARLTSLGVRVHSWIMGGIEDILNCYIGGSIAKKENSMPGCRRNRYKCCAGRKRFDAK